MNTTEIKHVEQLLFRLHQDARNDLMKIGKGLIKSVLRPLQPKDFEHAYLPITQQQGQFMRQLILEKNYTHVVEFGTSFGISTIYLADAVRQTGGKVITTELLESKANRAMEHLKAAGLAEYVDLRIGDAMKTLQEQNEPIDFLFLDGWKDLYLPLFQMLEAQFHSGTVIYADNIDMKGTLGYADYLLEKNSVYTTRKLHSGTAFLTSVI